MAAHEFATFTPLRRGWYRCNRDGAKVKKGRTHAHRVLHVSDPGLMQRLIAARLERQAEATRQPSYAELIISRRGSPV